MKRIKSYEELAALAHPLRWKIMKMLIKKEMHLREIAKVLDVSAASVHYHLLLLKNFLTIHKVKAKGGFNKYVYKAKDDSWLITFSTKPMKMVRSSVYTSFLGEKVTIVVGSPDPHGKYKVRARDAYLAGELSNYLGKGGIDVEVVWDTEVKSLKLYDRNLIILGGPLSNVIAHDLNPFLPIKFDEESGFRTLKHHNQSIAEETTGLIYGGKNPYSSKHSLLLLAGTTLQGTKAAILALIKEKIMLPGCYVVEGVDKDSNGIIDDIDIIATI